MTRRWKLYVHRVPKEISGYEYDKYYVGITCNKNITDRWGKDGSGYKGQLFFSAIQKYGWNNIEHKVLETDLSKEDAQEKEKETIKQLHSLITEHGYNVSCGGEGKEGVPNVNFQDLTGKKFGKLTVLNRVKSYDEATKWNCVCECGNTKIIFASNLKRGIAKSCGCDKYIGFDKKEIPQGFLLEQRSVC